MDTFEIGPRLVRTIETSYGIRFTAFCIGGRNWGLGGLYCQEDTTAYPEFASALAQELNEVGARRVFAPTPTQFNGLLVEPEELSTQIVLARQPDMLTMHRRKGIYADGTLLCTRGDAGVFSAGGCPMIVVAYKGMLIFAHAGRDCIIDRVLIDTKGEKKGRPHESVVDSIMQRILQQHANNFDPSMVEAWVFWSISQATFGHTLKEGSTHKSFNEKMRDYLLVLYGPKAVRVENDEVQLNLPLILHKQFESWRVDHVYTNDGVLPSHYPTTRTDNSTRCLMGAVRND